MDMAWSHVINSIQVNLTVKLHLYLCKILDIILMCSVEPLFNTAVLLIWKWKPKQICRENIRLKNGPDF